MAKASQQSGGGEGTKKNEVVKQVKKHQSQKIKNNIPRPTKPVKLSSNDRSNTTSVLHATKKSPETLSQVVIPKSMVNGGSKHSDHGSSKLTHRSSKERPLYGPPPPLPPIQPYQNPVEEMKSRSSNILADIKNLSLRQQKNSFSEKTPIGAEVLKQQDSTVQTANKQKLKWSTNMKPPSTLTDNVKDKNNLKTKEDKNAKPIETKQLQTTKDCIISDTMTDSDPKLEEERKDYDPDFSFSMGVAAAPKENMEDKMRALDHSIMDIGLESSDDQGEAYSFSNN